MSNYFHKLLDPTSPTASLRHASFALVVVSGCSWLTIALFRPGIDGNWVAAFGLLLAAVTTGKVMGQTDGPAGSPATGDGSSARAASDASVPGSAQIDATFASNPNRGQA